MFSPYRVLSSLLIVALAGCAAAPSVSIRTLEREDKSFERAFHASPIEKRLLRMARSQASLQGRDLLEASLIASGVKTQSELEQHMNSLVRLEASLRSEVSQGQATEREIARTILTWLHDKVFRTYQARESSVVKALEEGEFNCVSATAIFNALLHRFGIQSKVVDSPTHVLSHAFVDGVWVEVETTNPRGFDPFRSEAEYRAFLRSRGLRSGYQRLGKSGEIKPVLITRSSQRLRLVNNAFLPGFIVWNDAILAVESGQRKRGWKLYEMASRMLPGEDGVRRNADVFLNNLAFEHMENKDYAKVLRLLLFADHERRDKNIRSNLRIMMAHSFDQLASQAVERMDVDELEDTLRFAHRKMGKHPVLDHNHALYVGRLAKKLAAQGELRKGLKLIARHMHWDKEFLSARYGYLVSKAASERQAQGEKESARRLLEREIPYLTSVQGDTNNLGVLEEMLGIHYFREDELEKAANYFRLAMSHGNGSSARSNLGVCLFNMAVHAFNKRDCGPAQQFAREARNYRDSSTLDRILRECVN